MSLLVRFSLPGVVGIILISICAVNAYPNDPQARNGLTSCMDVLLRMSVAWPSAGRAWELLHGSKPNIQNAVCPLPTTDNSPIKAQKRTADHFLNDDSSIYLQSATREGLNAVHDQLQQHALSGSQNFFPLYERWPGEGNLNSFSGGLSTSVLPQQYSTGFVDRVPVRISNTHPAAGVGIGSQQEPPLSRRGYPRFWSDYSALSQLGAPFTNSVDHENQQHQQPHSQTYPISTQYSLYGE
jgi:hypothetical protein